MTDRRAKECLGKLAEYLEKGICQADDDYLKIAGFRDVAEYKKALSLLAQKNNASVKTRPNRCVG